MHFLYPYINLYNQTEQNTNTETVINIFLASLYLQLSEKMLSFEVEGVSKGIGDKSSVVINSIKGFVGSGVEQKVWMSLFFFTFEDGEPEFVFTKLSLTFLDSSVLLGLLINPFFLLSVGWKNIEYFNLDYTNCTVYSSSRANTNKLRTDGIRSI